LTVNSCHPERKHYAKGLCSRCYVSRPEYLAIRKVYRDRNKHKWPSQKELTREWRAKNADRSRFLAKRQRERKDEWFRLLKSQLACERCGESDPACLDFHHKDPAKKDGEVSKMIRTHSTLRISEEIAKCSVLCANCHRKLHAAERKARAA
jgi:hypothetical protein